MNFNLDDDDPLGDLLSDNSNDNDSFFESQPGRKKIVNKSPANKSGKGKMEDLFGIKEESEPQFKVPPIRASLPGRTKAEKTLATTTPKVKANTNEDDDLLSDLGFDPKKPKSTVATKSSLFDDILGSMETKKPNTTASLKLDELSIRKDDAASTRGTISRQSTDTTENSGFLGPTRPKTSTGRRTSVTPPTNTNPLDFFPATKEKEAPRVPTPKARKRGTTADWLGLGTESEEEPVKLEAVKRPDTPPQAQAEEVIKIAGEVESHVLDVPTPVLEQVSSSATMPMASSYPFMVTTANLGSQNASQIINQQESQMSVAAQLKNQEAVLLEMQRRQQELLSRQDMQFNDLLQKQLSRQNQLEQSIKAQQDRINAHIQFLMSQPANVALPTRESSNDDHKCQETPISTTGLIELEADVKRLELEKLRLEDLVTNMNANYEKEIEMIEKSFRKQIEVLEDHLTSVEVRLKGEIESLHRFYTEKLKAVEEDKQEVKTRLEANLVAFTETHDEEIRRLKKAQEDDLDALRDDHRRMLETIRQSKLLEFAVVQENGSYLETLRMASNNLESVSGDLQSLRAEMGTKLDIIHREKELKLEAREKKLDDSERRLKIVEETTEDEKRRLMELVSSLESQLTKLSKDSSEENWIMRQRMASLEGEKLTFEKEKSLAREQIAKDERRVEELKEHQLNEAQRQMQLIQEEHTKLNIEKSKLQTAQKLEQNTDHGRSRQEIDAALKVAHDATQQAEVDRERFFKLQRQLETQKRELTHKEHMIRSKEEELEQDVSLARANERRAQEAAQKSRLAEQSFNEKIVFLQQKMRELTEKESRLSQERLTLAQERIDLQNLKSKLEQNRCSLCRIGEGNGDLSQMLRPIETSINGIPVIDDHQYTVMQNTNAVDRFLDENITESLERIKDTREHHWDGLDRPTLSFRGDDDTNLDFLKYDPTRNFLRKL